MWDADRVAVQRLDPGSGRADFSTRRDSAAAADLSSDQWRGAYAATAGQVALA
jgi:hypothetical protein